jgi:hypothetical protein
VISTTEFAQRVADRLDRPLDEVLLTLRERGILPQWAVVADLLQRLAGKLERPTWIDAGKVLDEVSTLYRGRMPLGDAAKERPGLAALARRRIETSFIRRQQQLGLLEEYVHTMHSEDWGETAALLLNRIRERAGSAPPGKP